MTIARERLELNRVLRLSGGIWLSTRQWGGLLNVAAILLFMVNTGWVISDKTGN